MDCIISIILRKQFLQTEEILLATDTGIRYTKRKKILYVLTFHGSWVIHTTMKIMHLKNLVL